jgi:ribosomal protein S3AE
MVLGKIASDVYNEAKKVAPLRHVGIRKSKLLAQPIHMPLQQVNQAQKT